MTVQTGVVVERKLTASPELAVALREIGFALNPTLFGAANAMLWAVVPEPPMSVRSLTLPPAAPPPEAVTWLNTTPTDVAVTLNVTVIAG